MKALKTFCLALCLALGLSACGNAPSVTFSDTIVQEAISEKALLLDVRSETEFASGHVKGAINLPMASLENIENLASDKDTPIYLYCRSGNRSQKAKTLLEEKGYTKVIDLGGISNYKGELEK